MSDIFQKNTIFSNWKNWKITSLRDVRAIAKATIRDRFIVVPVTGNSLKESNILHGDLLIIRLTDKFSEKALCVWQTPHGRTAKFAYKEFDQIVLHNKHSWQQVWKTDEIKLIGIVVRVERDLEESRNNEN